MDPTSLNPGDRLGPYEITGALGAGGMGEVFRARDTRLGRDVAIKIVPQHLSSDSEVRARFEQEAKTISNLNHPHICTLFDVGREGDIDYLVMELIEGETLGQRLEKGALPMDDMLKIGSQIADALDQAHRAGVIHRDLKPGNVMLTKAGAKLMDFGLARAVQSAGPSAASGVTMADLTHSPTVAQPNTPLTAEGTIIGTFLYMSPEQLEGSDADVRSDLWALGCVLHEMATGRRAFDGKSQASVIGSIMGTEPVPISSLVPMAPPGLERLVQACLAKDPEDRLQSAHDIRMQLAWLHEGGSQVGVPVPVAARRRSRERLAWMLATVALLAVAVLAWRVLAPTSSEPVAAPPQVLRFEVGPPPGASIWSNANEIELSPDGTTLIWGGHTADGQPRRWARPLDAVEAVPLPAFVQRKPIFSPDGESIAFVNDGKIRTVSLKGGDPSAVCNANSWRGASWGAEHIAFALEQGPIYVVPATGGDPQAVTTVNASKGETAHRYPHFLPDGETFLFAVIPGKQRVHEIYAGHVDGREPVLVTHSLMSPVYTSGHLVYQRGRRFLAQAFDPRTLTLSGETIDLGIAPTLWEAAGSRSIAASRNGTLAFLTPDDPNTRLLWRDETTRLEGRQLELEPGAYREVRFSPDGRHVAFVRDVSPEESDIWVLELERNILQRFTQGGGNHDTIDWSPDGKWIGYSTDGDGPWNIYRKPFPGPGDPQPVVTDPRPFKNLLDYSPDGQFVMYSALGEGTNMDLWYAPADGSGEPTAYQAQTYQEDQAQFSPDGRWVVFAAIITNRNNVYIDSFPTPGQMHQVSIDGGWFPGYNKDGTMVSFYHNGRRWEATLQTEPTLRTGIPKEMYMFDRDVRGLDVHPDGDRALVIKPATERRPASVTVVLNLFEALEGE